VKCEEVLENRGKSEAKITTRHAEEVENSPILTSWPLSADAGRKREKIPKGAAQLTTFSYINNDFDGPDVVLFPHFRVPVLC